MDQSIRKIIQWQTYSSPQEFWDEVAAARASGDGPQWYRQAVDYWDAQDASDNGVLGGFEELSGPDLADSKRFLTKVGAALRSFHCPVEQDSQVSFLREWRRHLVHGLSPRRFLTTTLSVLWVRQRLYIDLA